MSRHTTNRAALAAGQFAWDNAEPEVVTWGNEQPADDDEEAYAADIDAIEFERGW